MAQPIPINKIEAQRQAWKRGEWSSEDTMLAEACAEGDRVFYGLPKDNMPPPWAYRWTVDAIKETLDSAGYRIAKKVGRPPKVNNAATENAV